MLKILIKMPNWVGDCIMATPAISLLRQAFPSAQIDALCRPSVAGVLLDNPALSQLIAADDRKLGSGAGILPAKNNLENGNNAEVFRNLKQTVYDAAVLMPNSLGSAWLATRLRIPIRIGYNRNKRWLLLTSRIPYNQREWQTGTPKPLSRKSIPADAAAAKPGHMVDYYNRIAERTIHELNPGRYNALPLLKPEMTLTINPLSTLQVNDMLTGEGLEGKRLIGLNPGAAYGSAKRWPPKRLAEAASHLAGANTAFICTASRGEAALTDDLQVHANFPVHRLGEQLDLRGLAALLSRLDLLITNDSGVMHMAAALKVPIAAIFGPTDWNVTRPWNANNRVIRNPVPCSPCFLRECPIDHPCMRELSPDMVETAIGELLRMVPVSSEH